MKNKLVKSIFAFTAILSTLNSCDAQPPVTQNPQINHPEVNQNENSKQNLIQVVFALDATGSMAGLISTAKEKIWSIASSLSQAQNTDIEMGLVFYRDKGDAFVTKIIPLSKDLDDVYEQLMAITADGGGDTPESVNKGLYDALVGMQWNKNPKTYKSIFLVGDCPPHMDYQDDVKYYESCKIATKLDVVLNTILMGNSSEAYKIWNEIANCNQGSFVQVGMDANNISVNTPYDIQITEISIRLDKTRIYYGKKEIQQKNFSKAEQSTKFKDAMTASTSARRAEYNTTAAGELAYYGSGEMVSEYEKGKVKLDSVRADQLPDNMKNMTITEKKAYIEKNVQERKALELQMKELVAKRQAYIEQEIIAKKGEEAKNSFEYKVYENIKNQAEKKNIKINGNVKF
ncbi:MAG: VWA domain-containing protein [Bacteroidetes bacterium]|nr:VWA domain-containing protein [Bacteroidota bacterium]